MASRPTLHPLLAGGLLLLPVFLIAGIDFVCRLHLASLLELHHHPAARAAALRAAGLGVAKDLVFVLPAYAVFALAPRTTTLRVTHVVFGLVLLILAGDVAYFYHTFEHVEPVLFVNINLHSIRGILTAQKLLIVVAAAVALFCLVRMNGRILAVTRVGATSPWVPAFLTGTCIAIAAPAFVSVDPTMPRHEDPMQRFLNKTRNAYLSKVSDPIVGNLFAAIAGSRKLEKESVRPVFEAYAPEERAVLDELGLLGADAPGRDVSAASTPEFRRVVLLVLESLPAAYLHHYNSRVPPEATPFFDELLQRYPRFDHFYTSNMPSDWGMNSMFLSRLRPDWAGGRASLLSVLRDELGFESYYVRGVSKHYANELETYARLFQMDHYYAFEELEKRYDAPWRSGWGFNNAVVYEEGVRILRENRDRRLVLVLKTIDLHQPGPFQGIPLKYLPKALQERNVGLFNALHWVDHCVRVFFEKLEQEKLFDDHTLVVVTSDHTPHPGAEYKQTVPAQEYRRLGRLPLIFVTRDPGALPDLDTAGFSSQVDFAPTILALLGVPKPRGFVGRSLIGSDARRVGLGVYRDRFYYGSAEQAFTKVVHGTAPEDTLRNRAIRKWLSNLDTDPEAPTEVPIARLQKSP